MKVNFIKQSFLLRLRDIDLFEGKIMLDPFTVLGRGASILTNVIAISRITGLCKDDDEYVVEL